MTERKKGQGILREAKNASLKEQALGDRVLRVLSQLESPIGIRGVAASLAFGIYHRGPGGETYAYALDPIHDPVLRDEVNTGRAADVLKRLRFTLERAFIYAADQRRGNHDYRLLVFDYTHDLNYDPPKEVEGYESDLLQLPIIKVPAISLDAMGENPVRLIIPRTGAVNKAFVDDVLEQLLDNLEKK